MDWQSFTKREKRKKDPSAPVGVVLFWLSVAVMGALPGCPSPTCEDRFCLLQRVGSDVPVGSVGARSLHVHITPTSATLHYSS